MLLNRWSAFCWLVLLGWSRSEVSIQIGRSWLGSTWFFLTYYLILVAGSVRNESFYVHGRCSRMGRTVATLTLPILITPGIWPESLSLVTAVRPKSRLWWQRRPHGAEWREGKVLKKQQDLRVPIAKWESLPITKQSTGVCPEFAVAILTRPSWNEAIKH